MKNIILSAAIVLLAVNTFANESAPVSKQVKVSTSFNKLVVYGDIEVVLTTEASGVITIDGTTADIEGITVQVKNGKLVIDAVRSIKKAVVRIPVNQLKEIDLHGDAVLSSVGTLNTAALNIFLDGACDIKLTAVGKINITHSGECYIDSYSNNK